MNKNNIINDVCNCFKMNVDMKGLEQLEEYISNLQKKAELEEHYKYLYSLVKKQKDDVVEYIKKHTYNPSRTKNDDRLEVNPKDLLRMLGEIDVKD